MQRNVFGIGLATLLIAAAGAAASGTDVPAGGVVIPVGAGSAQVVIEINNKTGKSATDITVSLEGNNNVNITEVDLLNTTKDKVDDNGNGQLDNGEDDTTADPKAKTVKTILDGTSISKGAKGHQITIKFDGPTQEGAKLRVKLSRKIGDTHYDMLAMNDAALNQNGEFMVSTGAAQVAPGFLCSDPQMGIGMIELFGNPENPLMHVQLPVGHFGDVLLDGPNAMIFIDPPLPPQVLHGLGLEFLFPVDEFGQFPMFFNTQLVPVFEPQPCIADFNEDGVVDVLDFIAFQNAWTQHDPDADINGDGMWNILDFLEFQNKWQEGCAQDQVKLVTDFENFDLGGSCQNGWESWDNNGDCGTIVDTNSRTGEQCLELDNADGQVDDVVIQFEDVDEGVWQFRCWTYIPAGSEGVSYISLFNEYTQGGNKDWSGILALDATQGLIIDDPLNQQNPPSVPYIVDQWVPIDVVVDLENDATQVFYAGEQFVFNKSWTAGVGGVGIAEFQAVNFFADSCTKIFYDDIMLLRLDD